jgi:hypothetical protein
VKKSLASQSRQLAKTFTNFATLLEDGRLIKAFDMLEKNPEGLSEAGKHPNAYLRKQGVKLAPSLRVTIRRRLAVIVIEICGISQDGKRGICVRIDSENGVTIYRIGIP